MDTEDLIYTLRDIKSTYDNKNIVHVTDPIFADRLFNMKRFELVKKKHMSNRINLTKSINFELRKINKSDVTIIPIKTTSQVCIALKRRDFINSKLDYEGIAHWIIAIIHRKKRELWIMDSLNIRAIFDIWKVILTEMFKNPLTSIKKFASSTQHQNNSLNCGYFCCLYAILTLRNKSFHAIENHRKCVENYVEHKFKKRILKIKNKK